MNTMALKQLVRDNVARVQEVHTFKVVVRYFHLFGVLNQVKTHTRTHTNAHSRENKKVKSPCPRLRKNNLLSSKCHGMLDPYSGKLQHREVFIALLPLLLSSSRVTYMSPRGV